MHVPKPERATLVALLIGDSRWRRREVGFARKEISMVLFRDLVALAAISLFSTSATALTMEECRAQYKAEKAAGTGERAYGWIDYQVKICGIDPKASAPTPKKPTAQTKH